MEPDRRRPPADPRPAGKGAPRGSRRSLPPSLFPGADGTGARPFPAAVPRPGRRAGESTGGPDRPCHPGADLGASVILVHDLEVPFVLAVRATFRDRLHVDLELLPALGAQDDPFAHEAASFRGARRPAGQYGTFSTRSPLRNGSAAVIMLSGVARPIDTLTRSPGRNADRSIPASASTL